MSAAPIILGTAGHIDHGKTTLVKALTGIDTDRLKVEKERGITTELGFAHLDLGDTRYGFVDVPGHEKFIRSMVAGAAGIDLVCLVVAADEGLMPQTHEHLDICQLLGVRSGFVALTKADLMAEEWTEMVREEVAGRLRTTFLSGCSIIPVSAKSGAGLDAIRAEIEALARALPPREASGALRLPVDRVFSVKGFGTVVTGTVFSGVLEAGDAVEILPGQATSKARGIQVHGDDVTEARAGMRCAVNLSSVDTADVRRGEVLSHPGAIVPTHILDVELDYLSTCPTPLGHRSRAIIHHGTTQVLGHIVFAGGRKSLAPGERAFAQLRVDRETPLAAVPGDRFLLRGFVPLEHYGTTIGGGVVLRVHARKLRGSSEDTEAWNALRSADDGARAVLEVERSVHHGLTEETLGQRLGLSASGTEQVVTRLAESGELLRLRHAGGLVHLITPKRVAELEERALDVLRKQGGEQGSAELRGLLPAEIPDAVWYEVLAGLERRGAIELGGSTIAVRGRGGGPRSALATEVEAAFSAWGLAPLRPKELPRHFPAAQPDELERATAELLKAGALVKIKSDLWMHRDCVDGIRRELEDFLDREGSITPAQWKQLTGTTRKYSIPLAEHFDQQKLTLRVGDVRKRRG